MKRIFLLSKLLLISVLIHGSELKISNVASVQVDYPNQLAVVEFNVDWEESWRNQVNHDAIWLFVKYKGRFDPEWKHGRILLADSLHQWPASAEMQLQPGGAFLAMKQKGQGVNHFTNIRLAFRTEGYYADTSQIRVKVYGVEMVYIPRGAFYLGDGSSHGSFEQKGSSASVPVGEQEEMLKCQNTIVDDPYIEDKGLKISGTGGLSYNRDSLNADFPTGYRAFYLMKYELSQRDYTAFLNSLPPQQALLRYPDSYGKHRHGINYDTESKQYTCDQSYLPCNYLSWADGCAWADWAGLRPTTETEYEKAARGDQSPAPGDMAWGKHLAVPATEVRNPGTGTETPSDIKANCAANPLGYDETPLLNGPMRSGCFANNMWQRSSSGVSPYGAFELCGNLRERCVSIGNLTGRSYTGINGDGLLSPAGNANQTDWPGLYNGEVTEADGSGTRGGSWLYGIPQMRISNRHFATMPDTYRSRDVGYRAAYTITKATVETP